MSAIEVSRRANPFELRYAVAEAASRPIGEAEFASAYAAAEFALEFEMPMDTSVTVVWSMFGITNTAEVQAAFMSFRKCMRDWLQRRAIPIAHVFAHEHGPIVGLHTHIILYLPGTFYRAEFRRWVQAWVQRFAGRHVPRAARVTGPKTETNWLHWLNFCYLQKQHDRACVVQSARNASDGRDTLLSDLIPFAWQTSGPVGIEQRVGASRSLGPDRRSVGTPGGLDYLLRQRDDRPLRLMGFNCGSVAPVLLRTAKPFRSKYEDGVRDVRALYGDEFVRRITGKPSAALNDVKNDVDLAWLDHLKI